MDITKIVQYTKLIIKICTVIPIIIKGIEKIINELREDLKGL